MLSNELFDIPKRRHIHEINIVPILDMLTTIIFFLLLSTSFMQYNKLTIPPSRTSVISTPQLPPPLQARLLLAKVENGDLRLILHWAGAQPGAYSESFSVSSDATKIDELISKKAFEFVSRYKKLFASERTVQLGMGKNVAVSKLILIMDSVREQLPDIVLISAADAQSEAEKFAGEKR